jgi:hypothetical protein
MIFGAERAGDHALVDENPTVATASGRAHVNVIETLIVGTATAVAAHARDRARDRARARGRICCES